MAATTHPAPSRDDADQGFTLIEVIVAFALLAVMATALLVVVTATQRLTREDAYRVVANNLASRELEITRDAFSGASRGPSKVVTNRVVNPSKLPTGTAEQPYLVDGVPYTVVRDAQWSSVGSQTSTCDDGSASELAYLKVEVQVSWPGLGSRPPVSMDTIMTPGKGTYQANTGHIGLKVIDRLGAPRAGVQVEARSSSGTSRTARTASDGCVLFTFLNAGDYTLTLTSSGEVNPAGSPTATRTVRVQAGQLWRGTQEYDGASTITATLTPADGFALPSEIDKIPLSLGNSALLPTGRRAVTGSGTVRTLTNLWPYPSGYQLWAGGCADNDPGDARAPAVDATPRATTTASIAVPAVEISTSASGAGTEITATHAADSVCSTAVSVRLGSASGTVLRTALPFGTWTLKRAGSNASTTVTIAVPPVDRQGAPATAPVTRVVIP